MTLVFIIIFSQVNDHLQQKKLCFIGPPWIAEIPIPVSGLFPVRRCWFQLFLITILRTSEFGELLLTTIN